MKRISSKSIRDVFTSTRGIISFFSYLGLIAFFSTQAAASTQSRQEQLRDMLTRITKGETACFTDACQDQKTNLLLKIQTEVADLPSYFYDKETPPSSGISSAFRLVRSRFSPLAKPESLSDWHEWWKRRAAHDISLRSDWMKFKGELSFYRFAIYQFLKFAQQPDIFTEDFRRIWLSGGGRIASLLVESSKISDKLLSLQATTSQKRRDDLERQLKNLQSELDSLEDETNDDLANVLADSFPQLNRGERFLLLRFLDRASNELMISDPLDSQFIGSLRFFYKKTSSLYSHAQSFEDLEYGVLGLENFDSPTNPAIAAHTELAIQNKLNQVDGIARELIDFSAYILFFLAADKATSGSHFLSMFIVGANDFMMLENNEQRFSDYFIKPSQRSSQLEEQAALFGMEMESRRERLEAEKAFLERELLKIEETNTD